VSDGRVAANKAVLKRALKSYEKGDLEPILALLDENIVWRSNALAKHYRFAGRRQGRAGVIEALSMIAADFQVSRYEPIELVGEGDVIWASSEVSCLDRKAGRQLSFLLVNRWEFRDGRIVSCSEFFDTADVLQQQGRLPDPLPVAVRA
jgi:ketosteroid isomerase-like protein